MAAAPKVTSSQVVVAMGRFDRYVRGRENRWYGNWVKDWGYVELLQDHGRVYPTRKIIELASGVAPGRGSYEAARLPCGCPNSGLRLSGGPRRK